MNDNDTLLLEDRTKETAKPEALAISGPVTGRALLFDIHSWARPHDSETEVRFAKEYLDTIPGMQRDAFGNRWLKIDDTPILWSCHIDTVGFRDGPQPIEFDPVSGILSLAPEAKTSCLGADDGAGVWLMMEMIRHKRPGTYVFHRGEERGCLGSGWLRDHSAEYLARYKAAIALDRANHSDVITFQSAGRTCSDAFAQSLADQLNDAVVGFAYRPDPTGLYTDTNEYARIIPECTNLSIGYHGNHGASETLDVYHVERLLSALLTIEFDKLVIARDPTVREYRGLSYGGGWHDRYDDDDDWNYGSYAPARAKDRATELSNLTALCEYYPAVVAGLIMRRTAMIRTKDVLDEIDKLAAAEREEAEVEEAKAGEGGAADEKYWGHYLQGWDARAEGKGWADNPYSFGSDAYDEWERGWDARAGAQRAEKMDRAEKMEETRNDDERDGGDRPRNARSGKAKRAASPKRRSAGRRAAHRPRRGQRPS